MTNICPYCLVNKYSVKLHVYMIEKHPNLQRCEKVLNEISEVFIDLKLSAAFPRPPSKTQHHVVFLQQLARRNVYNIMNLNKILKTGQH